MNLLEKLIPKTIKNAQEEREKTTQEVLTSARQNRRLADKEVIKAYRSMGQRVRRHEWSD